MSTIEFGPGDPQTWTPEVHAAHDRMEDDYPTDANGNPLSPEVLAEQNARDEADQWVADHYAAGGGEW